MVNHTKISPLFYTIIKIEGMKSFYAWHQATSLEQIMFVPDITQKGGGAVMMNKKVLIIPPADTFSKYVKTEKGSLRVAFYAEKLFPFHAVQMMQGYYSYILSLQSNWKLVGIYTDDNSINKNKNNFNKLLDLCKSRKIDMVICNSPECLSERTKLLNEMKIPIYVLGDNRIIDNEVI